MAVTAMKAPKLKPYRVLAPRVTEIHLEDELNRAWEEGYQLQYVVPSAGAHDRNVFLIMVPRGKK